MMRASWYYFGVTIDPAGRNASGVRWSALVSLPGYAGFLRADTKDGMRELIRHYRVTK
jgi:hypothetical protein